jgi:hypothetical protein
VRWDELFDDLDAQWEAAEQEELRAEVADRSRLEAARIRLVDRLRRNVGSSVVMRLVGEDVRGEVGRVGADWVLLDAGLGAEILVPLSAIVMVQGLTTRSSEPGSEGPVTARLGLGHVLRAVARDRTEVLVVGTDGSRWGGRIERVGADHLELARHDPGEPSRVRDVQYLTFAGVACVRTAPRG